MSLESKNHREPLSGQTGENVVCAHEEETLLFGKIEDMKDEYVPKKLLVCATEQGKRFAGGQHIRWSDAVTRDLTHLWIRQCWQEGSI